MARRRPSIPKLDGIPSPGLRRMRRMRPAELRAHLDCLEQQIQRITDRLERLEQQPDDEPTRSAREARLQRAIEQRRRLVRLVEEGRWMLGEDRVWGA